jgi:hypothetical protein
VRIEMNGSMSLRSLFTRHELGRNSTTSYESDVSKSSISEGCATSSLAPASRSSSSVPKPQETPMKSVPTWSITGRANAVRFDATTNPGAAIDQCSIKIEQHRRDSHSPILTHAVSSKTQTGPDRSRGPLQKQLLRK